jgi:RNA polymerase sigma-70 factor, ECF subfamily
VNRSRGWGRLTSAFALVSPVILAPQASVALPAPEAEAAFADLYAEHSAFVWRCLRGLGVAAPQLEDAAQDVFVVVHQRLPSFQRESTLRTWIFGIVRRIAYRYRRSAKRKGGVAPLEQEPAAAGPGPLEHLQDEQAAAFVDEFSSQLERRKREVFVLGVLEGLSVPEIAEALGVPLNTAYTRLRRARADFRKALAERLEST